MFPHHFAEMVLGWRASFPFPNSKLVAVRKFKKSEKGRPQKRPQKSRPQIQKGLLNQKASGKKLSVIIMVFITTPPRRQRQSVPWRGHLLPSSPRRPQTLGPRSPLRGVTIRQDGGGPVRQEPVRPWGRRPKAKPGGGQRVRANPGEQVS